MSEIEIVTGLQPKELAQSENSLIQPEISLAHMETGIVTPETTMAQQPISSVQQTYQPPVIDFDIPRNSQGQIEWKKLQKEPDHLLAFIEFEAFKAKQAGIEITGTCLRANKLIPLYSAIELYYPGGMIALRDKLDDFRIGTADPETGIYTDEKGEQWGTRRAIGSGRYTWIKKKGYPVRTILGRSGANKVELMNLHDFKKYRENHDALPEVDLETGSYTDDNGEQWISNRTLLSRRKLVRDNPDKVRSIQGKISGSPGTLYNLADTTVLFSEKFPAATIEKDSGIYTDENGKQWITETHAYHSFGQSGHIMKKNKIPTLNGRDSRGIATDLYSLEGIIALKQERDALPHTSHQNGVYIDNNGREFSPVSRFKPFGLTKHRLKAAKVSTITGLDRQDKKANLYDVEEALSLVKKLQSIPRVDKISGIYTDETGQQWTSLTNLVTTNSQRKAVQGNQDIRRLAGLDKALKEITLFNSDDVNRIIGQTTTLPRLDDSGIYRDEQDNEWTTASFFGKELGISNLSPIYQLLSRMTTSKPGLGGINLFPRNETLEFLKNNLRNKTTKPISPDQADEMMRSLDIE